MSAFPTPDAGVVRRWGKTWIHTPAGGTATEVRLYRDDTETLADQQPSGLVVLFGTMEASGFAATPVKGDSLERDGHVYRVYDVKSDEGGGTPGTAGLHIHLTEA